MNRQLQNMMAEIESWESAIEFGVPEELLANYQVMSRTDDLYIAVLAAVFDTLRIEESVNKHRQLSDLAKTLLVYSRSAATKYLGGIDKKINILYCSAVFYLAEFPATATLLSKEVTNFDNLLQEEIFLYALLSHQLDDKNKLERMLIQQLGLSENTNFDELITYFQIKKEEGLFNDPRLFIAAKLTLDCLNRFKQFNIWDCIKQNAANYNLDVWRPFFSNSKIFPLWELFPSQISAINSGILSDSNTVYSMQMPTSSGKTSLCEILIYNEVKGRQKKVLFLVPFRALASEIKLGISARLESAGVTVVASHGGNIPTRSESATVETADVLIITPEKFTAIAHTIPELEDSFNTIICDEGHLIDDSTRGLQYELLLTKLKTSDNPKKIIFISAILPNVDVIHGWLGGTPDSIAKSEYKPVEIDFSFISKQDKDSWQLDFNTIYDRPRNYFLRNFLTKNDFRYMNPDSGRLKLIDGYNSYTSLACAAALKARWNGSVALFTTMKGDNGIRGLSSKFINFYEHDIELVNKNPVLSFDLPNLVEYIEFQFGKSYLLSKLLKYGIGFHHGDLPQEIRREMEGAIQNKTISLLICTSTLAEGVNLPIRTLVVHTIKRFNGELLLPIENRSLKNIIGRVGRAGKETKGRVIFANNGERVDVENVFRDLYMESASGALFKLIKTLNNAVLKLNIDLNNEIFESQGSEFLSLIDKIDIALIDLIPQEIVIEEIEQYVENIIETTLAYQYCDTDVLKDRIKEVFNIRTQYLQTEIPKESWELLKRSGSSPRYWDFLKTHKLIERIEWQTLFLLNDSVWIDEIVLIIMEMPTLQIDDENLVVKSAIIGWMEGASYDEISQLCNISIDDTLKLLSHTIGYKLQDGLSTLTQFAIDYHGEDAPSEIARNWASLLQYGLGSMQQLDLFEKGASDRLGVWGIDRYIKKNNIADRGNRLIKLLRTQAYDINLFLEKDPRVPTLSRKRVFDELKLNFSSKS